MATCWFLLAIFGLCWTSDNSEEVISLMTDPRYSSTFQAAEDFTWETYTTTEIRDKNNALMFTIPLARDLVLIDKMLDEEQKIVLRRSLPLYESLDVDLGAVENEVIQASMREMRFRTIYYGKIESLVKRNLFRLLLAKTEYPSERFYLIQTESEDQIQLIRQVESSVIGFTCEVRYCAIREILSSKAPFAILTLASWNITSCEGMHRGLMWYAVVKFALSETSSIDVRVMRCYGTYDYTEFKYPRLSDCTGRVVRLRYKTSFNMTFVIPSDNKMCSSSEDLWKNVQSVNLNRLNYERRTFFLSIPLFRVAAKIDLKMKLKGTVLARAFDQDTSGLYNALALQAAEVTFNPEIFNKNWPTADFGSDNFRAERPFYFGLYHSSTQSPIFASLINNPGCTSKCDKIMNAIE